MILAIHLAGWIDGSWHKVFYPSKMQLGQLGFFFVFLFFWVRIGSVRLENVNSSGIQIGGSEECPFDPYDITILKFPIPSKIHAQNSE